MIPAFVPERIRLYEWLIGASALVLLVSMFLPWFGLRGQLAPTFATLGHSTTSSGWSVFTFGDVFIGAAAAYGLAVWFAQGRCRGPALPVTLTVLLTPTAFFAFLLAFHRVVINRPGSSDNVSLRPAAAVGLIASAALLAAAFGSLRDDGIREEDGPGEIETFRQRRRPVGAV